MKNVQFEVGKKYGQYLCYENAVNAPKGQGLDWYDKEFAERTFTIKKRTPCRVTVVWKNGWEENLKVFKMLWVKNITCGYEVEEMEEEKWKKGGFWKDNFEVLGEFEYLKYQDYNCRKRKYEYCGDMIRANRTLIDQK
jgi:hypothetical protein